MRCTICDETFAPRSKRSNDAEKVCRVCQYNTDVFSLNGNRLEEYVWVGLIGNRMGLFVSFVVRKLLPIHVVIVGKDLRRNIPDFVPECA